MTPDHSTSPQEARGTSGRTPASRRAALYAAVLIAVFLLGLFPMWLIARARAEERDALQQQLRLSRLETDLAHAALSVRRGEYEAARESASRFYTMLRETVDAAEPGLTSMQVEAMRSLLPPRDEVITLLARSDPAAAERLGAIYMSFRQGLARNAAQP